MSPDLKSVDLTASERIADLVGAQEGRCVANVLVAILYHREALPENIRYVEGLWMVSGQTDIHAWIETEDTIIDPTLVRLRFEFHKRSEPILYLCEEEVKARFGGRVIKPGDQLELILDWCDVEAVRKEFDPP